MTAFLWLCAEKLSRNAKRKISFNYNKYVVSVNVITSLSGTWKRIKECSQNRNRLLKEFREHVRLAIVSGSIAVCQGGQNSFPVGSSEGKHLRSLFLRGAWLTRRGV